MSPIRPGDWMEDLERMPEVVDRWRTVALERVARCLRVQANGVVVDGVVGKLAGDSTVTEASTVKLGGVERGAMRVRDQAYRIEAFRRVTDDRTVLTGYATDETNRVLPGAKVTILRSDTGEVLFRGTADEEGHYIVDGSRATIETVIAAGVGITESIEHVSLEQPARSIVPSDRIDVRLTTLDTVRILGRPGGVIRPSGPSRPTGPVRPVRPGPPIDVTPVRPAPVSPTEPVVPAQDLSRVKGIGPRRHAHLASAGIADFASLASANAARVGEIAGVSTETAKEWITEAKRLLRSKT